MRILYFPLSLLVLLLFNYCNLSEPPSQSTNEFSADTLIVERFEKETIPSSVRALWVQDEQHIYFAGSGGVFGLSNDGGQTWRIDSIKIEDTFPHFRSIAVTSEAIFVLSVASPAFLLKSTDDGQSWTVVYREEHPDAFYDALAFWDDQYGMAMGDPTDSCLSVIVTKDGGDTWTKTACDNIPQVTEGEAAFAASNSNIAIYKDTAWMVSGGQRSRVYRSTNKGQSWEAFDTPMAQGGQMTGIYSIDFFNAREGIIFGGDWNDKDKNVGNKAVSEDGGQNWTLLADGAGPGYRSQVGYLPGSNGKGIIACGIPGFSYSLNSGKDWFTIMDEDFYTFDFVPDTKTIWLAGREKIAKMEFKVE